MGYHWGEKRRDSDRRVAHDPAYAGPDRRLTERRQHPKERKSRLGWVVIALVAFVMVDTVAWDGFYRRALFASINADAQASRAWSEGLW